MPQGGDRIGSAFIIMFPAGRRTYTLCPHILRTVSGSPEKTIIQSVQRVVPRAEGSGRRVLRLSGVTGILPESLTELSKGGIDRHGREQ